MNIVIVAIHVTAAVILVLTVLLQAGKGAGMGAAFGGASGTVFGTRGPATLISKITCAAAVVFMLTSLNLALSQSGGVRKGSVMDNYQSPAPITTPASPIPATESGESQTTAPVPTEEPVSSEAAASPTPTDEANTTESTEEATPVGEPEGEEAVPSVNQSGSADDHAGGESAQPTAVAE